MRLPPRFSRASVLALWIAALLTAPATRASPTGSTQAQRIGLSTVVVTMTNATLKLAAVTVPAGAVIFRIRNRGTIPRNFSIAGKSTRQIPPGKSGTLAADLSAKGFYTYSSVGRGRSGRITGLLNVLAPCTTPTRTTLDVQMAQDHGGITVSQSTIPCGTVTFVVTNTGTLVDSLKVFADLAQGQGLTPELRPGQTARLTVRFTVKGLAYYESGNYPPGEPELGEYDEGGQFAIV